VGKATLILDGCGDCGSFWFDKGEIDKIRKTRKVGDEMGI
jgi:Zn-finger nucleic acid-binding protein